MDNRPYINIGLEAQKRMASGLAAHPPAQFNQTTADAAIANIAPPSPYLHRICCLIGECHDAMSPVEMSLDRSSGSVPDDGSAIAEPSDLCPMAIARLERLLSRIISAGDRICRIA